MAPSATSTRGARRRIQLLALVVLALFALLAARAAWLGAVRASTLSERADDQHLITVNLPAARGSITSADGQLLAVDRPTMMITADGRYVSDPAEVAGAITSVAGGDESRRLALELQLRTKKPYIVLARNVPLNKAEYLRDKNLDGVHFVRTQSRSYPQGRVAGQLLGFTDLDNVNGIDGLEKSHDKDLAGRPGKRIEIRDPRLRQTVRILQRRDPEPGTSIDLTINAAIQEKMEVVLAQTRNTYKAKAATGIVMDPDTGDIVAMGSIPRVNPGDRSSLDPESLRNRAIVDPFEPGSVFKVITVAGALEERLTTPNTAYSLPPEITYKKDTPDEFTIGEAHREEWATLTTTDILQQSSNVGTIRLSKLLSQRGHLRRWMARFGFGQPSGIDIAGENPGNLPKLKWNLGQSLNIPFGQGMTATQLQLVRAYAAIANGGELVTPRVVAKIGGHATVPGPRTRVISPRTATQLTEILKKVVEGTDGTGVEAHLEGYRVAGKTGTAELVDPETLTYAKDLYRASFIGFVPANNPRLVIAVMVDRPDPEGEHTGGQVAAPAFKEIADYALSTLKIPPSGD
jgi:cell division protein FtsI/penicillin-binding protein 2